MSANCTRLRSLGTSRLTPGHRFPGPSIETGGHPDFDQPQAISLDLRTRPLKRIIAAPEANPSSSVLVVRTGRLSGPRKGGE